MRTLDRYILRSFLVSVVLWFSVLMSLRIVVDLFVNMDEFAKLGKGLWETLGYIGSYYGCHSLVYFTELGGVIIAVAAAFTLARMNQTNELTALLASGVSLHRVVWPIVLASMLLCGLLVVDREVLMPPLADQLVLRYDDVPGRHKFRLWIPDERGHGQTHGSKRFLAEEKAGCKALWYSRKFDPDTEVMEAPLVIVHNGGNLIARVRGEHACPGQQAGRHGWMLDGAAILPGRMGDKAWAHTPSTESVYTSVSPEEIRKLLPAEGWREITFPDGAYGGMVTQGRGRLTRTGGIELTRPTFTFRAADGYEIATITAESAELVVPPGRECYWSFQGGKLFFLSDLTSEDLNLRRSRRWQTYLSVRDLSKLLQTGPSTDIQPLQMQIQTRVTEPINALLKLLLCLPLILSRERNIKSSAGLCVLMVGTFYIFIYFCRYIGLPPLLAAWLPVLLFGPVAAVMIDSIKT